MTGSEATRRAAFAVRPLAPEESTRIVEAIFRSSEFGLLLTDLDHSSLACNARFGEFFDIDPVDVVNASVRELRGRVIPLIENSKRWLRSLEEIYRDPERIHEDDLVLRKGGQRLVLHRSTNPVTDSEGRITGRLWTFRDVTKERRLERMQEILVDVSTPCAEPTSAFQAILDRISEHYGRSTAILSIRQGDFMQFRAVSGPLSPLRFMKGNALKDAYCQLAFRALGPVMIQNARNDPELAEIRPAKSGLTRYLGVPVSNDAGSPIGTLCILDDKSDQPLDEEDVRFMSLLATRINAELAREARIQERLGEKDRAINRQAAEIAETQAVLEAMNAGFGLLMESRSSMALAKEQAKLLSRLMGHEAAMVVAAMPDGSLRGGYIRARDRRARETCIDRMEDRWLAEILSSRQHILHFADCQTTSVCGLLGTQHAVAVVLPSEEGRDVLVVLGRQSPPPEDDPRFRIHMEALIDQVYLVLRSHTLHRELQEAHQRLKTAQEQLVQGEKLRAVGALAASTAHDIKNILASLAMLVSPDAADPRQALECVREQIDRFHVLAHRLLSYARPRELARQSICIDEVLQRVLALTSAQLRITGVATSYRSALGTRVVADPHQLEHLFVNLVLNAVQAMNSQGGTLTISVEPLGAWVRIKVTDTGVGMSPAAAEKLFEPFASTRPQGFGLGLFSCKRIVDEHGGTIAVGRNRPKGTTFCIELPAVSSMADPR